VLKDLSFHQKKTGGEAGRGGGKRRCNLTVGTKGITARKMPEKVCAFQDGEIIQPLK